jgi:hypothetical protein
MPCRYIREGLNDSERVFSLSYGAQAFYFRLMLVVDDYGRIEADPIILLSRTFPRGIKSIDISTVEGWLDECCQGEEPLVTVYTVNRKRYLQVSNFKQRVRTESKFPAPPVALPTNDGQSSDTSVADDGRLRASRANSSSNSLSHSSSDSDSDSDSDSQSADKEAIAVEVKVAATAVGSNVLRMPIGTAGVQVVQGTIAVNGDACVPSRGRRSALSAPDLPPISDAVRDVWVKSHWEMHPKKQDMFGSMHALDWFYATFPDRIEQFERHHSAWCKEQDWLKEGARWCPPLVKYISDEKYNGPMPDGYTPPGSRRRAVSIRPEDIS